MKTGTVFKLLLAILGISTSTAGGGIAGLLLIASLNPGHKGPHITDGQAVGALFGGGLAALLMLWMKSRRKL